MYTVLIFLPRTNVGFGLAGDRGDIRVSDKSTVYAGGLVRDGGGVGVLVTSVTFGDGDRFGIGKDVCGGDLRNDSPGLLGQYWW